MLLAAGSAGAARRHGCRRGDLSPRGATRSATDEGPVPFVLCPATGAAGVRLHRRARRAARRHAGVDRGVSVMRNRVEVMHGVNLDQLGRRDPSHYGRLTLEQLEKQISDDRRRARARRPASSTPTTRASSSSICTGSRAWPTRSCSTRARGRTTPTRSATRSSWPACPRSRCICPTSTRARQWRRQSVISELCIARVAGKGPDGYRDALERVREELGVTARATSGRADRLSERLAGAGIDVLLVTNLVNVRYLTGYHGQQRDRAGRAAEVAYVHHRLPLRRAGGRGGRPGVRSPPLAAASARGGRRRRCRRASSGSASRRPTCR